MIHFQLLCFAPFPGAARDTVPDMGPVAGLWECGAVWRGQRAERWSSYYCHWNLWSRHSGKGCFQIVTLFISSILYGIMKIKGLTYLKYPDHLRDFHFKYSKKHVINHSNESQCILLLFFNWYIFNLFSFNSNCILLIFERIFVDWQFHICFCQ